MTSEYRYVLERGSKKHLCPGCNKLSLVRYIDNQTGEYLPASYGRCDRESKCAYHQNPYKDGYAKGKGEESTGGKYPARNFLLGKENRKPIIKTQNVFIPSEVLMQTLRPEYYAKNVFLQNLLARVDYPMEIKDVERVISMYYLGTINEGYRSGAVTFPFIDHNRNVRAVQVKQFDQTSHTQSTDFLHSILEKQYQTKNEVLPSWLEAYKLNESKVSCLFGEHLLADYPNNPIALVEAPKTAIYGMLYFGFLDQTDNLL